MSNSEAISILHALEQEKGMMQRQALLKRLWKLKQRQSENVENETPANNVAQPFDVTSAVPSPSEQVAFRRAKTDVEPQTQTHSLFMGVNCNVSP